MYWIGDDHHKETAYMTCLDAHGQLYCKRRLSASPEALRSFFAAHPKPFTVGIEATYGWEYVADIVEEMGQTVRVGNPQLLKAHARQHRKSDKVDSALMADRLFHNDFPAIVHPNKDARQLRDLYRQRMDLVRRRSSASSRAKAQADRLGFQATMNLSTMVGVEQFQALPVTGRHRIIFDSHTRLLTYLYEEIGRLEDAIDEVAVETPETRWLDTVPGIGHYLALLIWAEVFDATRFCSSRTFVGYSGTAPGSAYSGGKCLGNHLSQEVDHYLRYAFVEAALHYAQKCPAAQEKYDALKKAKNWKTARLAIARRIAVTVYRMLIEKREWKEEAPRPADGESKARRRNNGNGHGG